MRSGNRRRRAMDRENAVLRRSISFFSSQTADGEPGRDSHLWEGLVGNPLMKTGMDGFRSQAGVEGMNFMNGL